MKRLWFCTEQSTSTEIIGILDFIEHLEAWLATLPKEDHTSPLTARLRGNEWTAEPQLSTC
jgi:hypothetical protein